MSDIMATPSSVDTTAAFETFFNGKLFDSWDEFETTVSHFEKETNSVFRKKNTTTVAYDNKKRKEPIPERFKYAYVCYTCQHFGKARTQSSGQRKIQKYVALDCPVFFEVSYVKGSLRISKSSMCHANHKLEAKANQYLACNRQLTSEEEEAIKDILEMKPGNAFLQNFIRAKFGKKVLITDVKILKAKFKRKNDISSETLYKDFNGDSQCSFDGEDGEPEEDEEDGANTSHDFNNHSSNSNYNHDASYLAPSISTAMHSSSLDHHNNCNSANSLKGKRKYDSIDAGDDRLIKEELRTLIHERLLQVPPPLPHQQQRTSSDVTDSDEIEAIGRHVTNKLRKMSNEQRIYAEKLIYDVLFEGTMGSLSRSVSLNWKPYPVSMQIMPSI